MKKIILVVSIVLLAFFAVSCKSTLPGRFERFVSGVQKNYVNYDSDDWEKADQKFHKLYDKYRECRSSLVREDRKRINAAIVNYCLLAAKSEVDSVASSIRQFVLDHPFIFKDTLILLKFLL